MTFNAQMTRETARGAGSRPAEDTARCQRNETASYFDRESILGGSGTRPTGSGRNLETL